MSEDRIRILLVEDNPADARLLKEMLGDAGAAFDLTNAERLTEIGNKGTLPKGNKGTLPIFILTCI